MLLSADELTALIARTEKRVVAQFDELWPSGGDKDKKGPGKDIHKAVAK